jgi:ArsR family transcriptional regulator
MDVELRKQAQAQASFCGIFGNPQRVLILWALADRELSVGDIATAVEASLQNTSRHLHLMKDRGVLIARREGQTVYYRVANSDLMEEHGLLPPRLHQLDVSEPHRLTQPAF